jgi:hypothetical protein
MANRRCVQNRLRRPEMCTGSIVAEAARDARHARKHFRSCRREDRVASMNTASNLPSMAHVALIIRARFELRLSQPKSALTGQAWAAQAASRIASTWMSQLQSRQPLSDRQPRARAGKPESDPAARFSKTADLAALFGKASEEARRRICQCGSSSSSEIVCRGNLVTSDRAVEGDSRALCDKVPHVTRTRKVRRKLQSCLTRKSDRSHLFYRASSRRSAGRGRSVR